MSIQTDVDVMNLKKTLKEILERPTPDLAAIEKRVADLEAKYKMLNARVGWNRDKAA